MAQPGIPAVVELRILGALRLTASHRPDVEGLAHQAKRAALLAYLAGAVPRGPHRRDKLLALFWPELDEPRARAALSQAVYVLRSQLGEHAITGRGDGEVGLTRDAVWCDAVAFEAALDSGKPAEALALYRGDLLDGFFISGAPEFERWVDGERERLRKRAAEGAWALAEAKAAEGDAFEAARWARQAAGLFPVDEPGARRLMTLLHALGDRAAAMQVYETVSERLRQEYELEPSTETQSLAASIRREERRAPLRSVEPASAPPGTARVAVRRLPLGSVAASMGVVAVLAAGAWGWLRDRKPSDRPPVRFTLEFLAGQQMASAIGGSTIALSPDGSHLVYLSRGSQGDQLFLRSMDRVEAAPIPHTRGGSLPFFSPDGEWLGFVLGNTIRKVPLRGGPAITVCTVATNVPGASWGPNDVIVFATPAGLWQVPASGGDARLLAASDTARGERYRWPEVLPGGRAAVFTRVDDAGFGLAAVSLETGAVLPLGLEGTHPHFITPGYLLFARRDGALLGAPFDPNALRTTGPTVPATEEVGVGPAGAANLGVSGSGVLAYVPKASADRAVAIVDREGNAETVTVSTREFGAARFSPDGRTIATVIHNAEGGGTDIWVLDLTGNTLRRVTFDGGSLSPVWTPDGGRIAFATKPGGRPFGWAVRWISSAGADSAETLLPFAFGQFPAAFAPDGRGLILQIRDPVTRWDIWMLPLQGDKRPQPYLRGASDERSPVVSPDGRWLAYVSNEAGQDEVYVRPFPTSGTPVHVSSGGGWEPRWAPHGGELFYRNERGLVAAAVSTSPSFRVGQRTVLFDDRPYRSPATSTTYDVHPDGRRFLMIRRGAETPQVVVVLNWVDQLRAGEVAAGSAGRARQ